MSLKLFVDLMSQPSRGLVIFCKVANIPFDLKSIRLAKLEHKTEEFSKINPFQTVPAIEHNGVNIIESVAILRYLTNTHKVEEHWYPKNDPLKQAKVEEYLQWQHANTRLNCAMFFQHAWLIPTLKRELPNEKSVNTWKSRMDTTLDQIEKIWLDSGNKRYICGDTISVADILACCELEQPQMAGYDVRQSRPVLAAYMDRIKAELNPHYDEAHKVVYQMRDKFGGKIPGVNAKL